jgi:hypothetical protein
MIVGHIPTKAILYNHELSLKYLVIPEEVDQGAWSIMG